MITPSTTSDDQDSTLKPKQDIIPAVHEPVKRSYDEAFDDDHPNQSEA